jgi:hypothetical protein
MADINRLKTPPAMNVLPGESYWFILNFLMLSFVNSALKTIIIALLKAAKRI